MDQIFASTDNQQIIDHAEYYFSLSPDDDGLVDFYQKWIFDDRMPELLNYYDAKYGGQEADND
jgi:hypothetical protein